VQAEKSGGISYRQLKLKESRMARKGRKEGRKK